MHVHRPAASDAVSFRGAKFSGSYAVETEESAASLQRKLKTSSYNAQVLIIKYTVVTFMTDEHTKKPMKLTSHSPLQNVIESGPWRPRTAVLDTSYVLARPTLLSAITAVS